jgi:flagellar biosynthesis protein
VANPEAPKSGSKPIAIALRYDAGRDPAPRIVAKGHGAEAEDILRVAFANDVKVREDADLAELLHAVDLDSLIPLEAFTAVAEILSYLYRLNGGLPQSVRDAAARDREEMAHEQVFGTEDSAAHGPAAEANS